jgi:septum formation protein
MSLYLASQSPRRKQLLASLDIAFEVLPPAVGVDMEALEARRGQEAPLAYVKRVTLAKLHQARSQIGTTDAVLCADTTVALGRDILHKPLDATSNAGLLNKLQGRSHRVMTAVALWQAGIVHQAVSISHVTFAPLNAAQIDQYAACGEGWDKAGGYAIQGRAGAFVTRINGNYSGIVGLPLFETAQLLRQAGLLTV